MKKEKNLFKLKYNAIIESIDMHTGEITKTTKVHNLIVNGGLDRVANLIGGVSANYFEYVAIGTTNTSPANGNTALAAEVAREAVTATNEGVGIIEYDHTFTFATGDSFTIVEAGIFDSASSGVMLNRLVFSGHAVDVDNGVRVRITITVSR